MTSRRLEYVRWIAAVWIIWGSVSAIEVVACMKAAGFQDRWTVLFFTLLAGWLVFAAAAPGVWWLSRRFPVSSGNWRNLPIHIGAAMILGVSYPVWSAVLEWTFQPQVNPRSFGAAFLIAMYLRFHLGIIIYAVIIVVRNAIDSIRRLAQRAAETAQLEAELAKTQLDALRRQMEPRVLFNTLDGVAELVEENRNDEAVARIAGLSDLLRRLLDAPVTELVPLAEEISFLESYLEIQSLRLSDRPRVTVDVPRSIYAALVPPLLLQPLVENAIVPEGSEPGEIHLSAREAEGTVSIRIRNPLPPPASADLAEDSGARISNIRDRLGALYGGVCGFDLCSWEAGVEVILTVPLRLEA
jgi:hypothetical protein